MCLGQNGCRGLQLGEVGLGKVWVWSGRLRLGQGWAGLAAGLGGLGRARLEEGGLLVAVGRYWGVFRWCMVVV